MRQIMVAGFSGDVSQIHREAVERFVEMVFKKCGRDTAIIVGGYWGVMKIVVDKAVEKGLPVVILPPIEEEDTVFPEKAIVIKTGTSYRVRSIFMARSADAVVVLGGASGTILEAVAGYTEGKKVYVLRTGLDSDKLEYLAPYIDMRRLAEISIYSSVDDLVEDLCR